MQSKEKKINMKIGAEINQTKNRKPITKINKTQTWFSERINKIINF